MKQEPITWMTPDETEKFLRELKSNLRRGREVKPTTRQDYLEAKMYLAARENSLERRVVV